MKIAALQIVKRLNPRKQLSEDMIHRYMDTFTTLPPIVVQKGTHVLVDGFHRVEAAKRLGYTEMPAVEFIDIADDDLFAESVRRNLGHGLALSKTERNNAIVRLYQEYHYTQEALGEMFGIDKGQVSRIIGAEERTKRVIQKVVPHNFSAKLSPKHEQVIRKAPAQHQDKLAAVVLSRKEEEPEPEPEAQIPIPMPGKKPQRQAKSKPLTVSQTNTLVREIQESPDEADHLLDHLMANPTERRIVGTDDEGNIDSASVQEIIAGVKKNPGLAAEWTSLLAEISAFRVKYSLDVVLAELSKEQRLRRNLPDLIDYFTTLFVKTEEIHGNHSEG